ncbi:alpha/beta hydrolase [Streptomyces sp. H27-H5]|uniref:alpha/beta fold hydrolase n=1 Tax=Streptomyces sp. H27-H5 TaxID=2996460 RepID=UPI002D1E3B8E|nr:alpha/beta hydrolase [Streptomyces sp. H27-H5]
MTTPWTLADLEAAIRAGWSAETCSPDDVERAPWTAGNPAWGHCDITALVVQDLVGGELMVGEVWWGGQQQGFHCWNVLPGGMCVDLTREQFRLGQTITRARLMGKRPPGRLPRRWEEYRLLRRRVIERLGPLPGVVRAADGRGLAYTDFGGAGAPLLVLRGHPGDGQSQDGRSGDGGSFESAVRDAGPGWHVIALNLSGYGASGVAGEDACDGYVADAATVLEGLGLGPAVVWGRGSGEGVAYGLAARRPDLVRAVVELPRGHRARAEDPEGFGAAVREFLAGVPGGGVSAGA